MHKTWLLIFVVIATVGCRKTSSDVSTAWHVESGEKNGQMLEGSEANAIESLIVTSNQWKIIAKRNPFKYEWGFKVSLHFETSPKHEATKIFVPIMPVQRIEYELLDGDGFHLTTLTQYFDGRSVEMGTDEVFQASEEIDADLAKRASFGRLRVKAGYAVDEESPKTRFKVN